jgi:hypothetical protein
VLTAPEYEHLGGDNKWVPVIFRDEVDRYNEKGGFNGFFMGLRF